MSENATQWKVETLETGSSQCSQFFTFRENYIHIVSANKANFQGRVACPSFCNNLWCSQMKIHIYKIWLRSLHTPTNPWRNFRHIEWKMTKQKSFQHDDKKCQDFYPSSRSLALIWKLSGKLKLFGFFKHGMYLLLKQKRLTKSLVRNF